MARRIGQNPRRGQADAWWSGRPERSTRSTASRLMTFASASIPASIKSRLPARMLFSMNMQYSPRTASMLDVSAYADIMRRVAQQRSALLFDRLAIMQYWNDVGTFDLYTATKKYDMARRVHECIGRALASQIINCRASGRRKNANDALMSSTNKPLACRAQAAAAAAILAAQFVALHSAGAQMNAPASTAHAPLPAHMVSPKSPIAAPLAPRPALRQSRSPRRHPLLLRSRRGWCARRRPKWRISNGLCSIPCGA